MRFPFSHFRCPISTFPISILRNWERTVSPPLDPSVWFWLCATRGVCFFSAHFVGCVTVCAAWFRVAGSSPKGGILSTDVRMCEYNALTHSLSAYLPLFGNRTGEDGPTFSTLNQIANQSVRNAMISPDQYRESRTAHLEVSGPSFWNRIAAKGASISDHFSHADSGLEMDPKWAMISRGWGPERGPR